MNSDERSPREAENAAQLSYSSEMATKLAFGPPWNRLSSDAKVAERLSQGTLELPPHRAWALPEQLNWGANPFGEVNWVAQFHMLRWLDPLRREAERGKTKYMDTWERVALSWIEDNPPGRGMASYSWADMVEAARAVTFCLALPLLEKRGPEVLQTVLRSIEQHGEWLADDAHIRTGNHALQQHQGLLVIGAVMRRDDWVDLAVERSCSMLRTSYDHQGINEEGAIQYHQINYSWWNTLARRVQMICGDVPSEFELVNRAPLAMAHATRPDGNYELIGDTEIFSPRGVGHPATDYASSGGKTGVAPPDRTVVYDAGYVFGRSTWGQAAVGFSDADFYSLRFGPQNRIHGHVDGMALTLFHNGESLLVDSGKYAYDAKDPYRAHFLSRESHNSLSAVGIDYDKTRPVELETYFVGESCQHFRFADSGYSGVELTRDVLISMPEQLIVVIDSFSSESEATIRQHWHLNADAGHRRETDSIFTVTNKSQMRFAFVGSPHIEIVRGKTNPIQGWYSPTWRKKIENRVLSAETSGLSGRIATALSYGDSPTELSISQKKCADSGLEEFVVENNGRIYTACIGPSWGYLVRGEQDGRTIQQVLEVARHHRE